MVIFSGQKHMGWLVAIALSSCLDPIATPEAVAHVEQTFDTHRSELVELATTAVAELERSGASDQRLPEAPFYDRAWVATSLNHRALIVDFVIEEFYLPLVYISTDEPQDAHDACTNGGRVVKQLEPHWYICKRDWN
jgi:hypothetical protein